MISFNDQLFSKLNVVFCDLLRTAENKRNALKKSDMKCNFSL